MKDRFARFWYKFQNWFRLNPGPGKPLTFLCGSKEELRRVTRWMCQATPSLFMQECVIVHYYASDGQSSGHITFSGDFQHLLTRGEKQYLRQGCAIILQHNQFTGTEWLRDLRRTRKSWLRALYAPDGERITLFGYFEWPESVDVTIVEPSLTEQLASQVAFAEWLDAKIGADARRELLRLPDDVLS